MPEYLTSDDVAGSSRFPQVSSEELLIEIAKIKNALSHEINTFKSIADTSAEN